MRSVCGRAESTKGPIESVSVAFLALSICGCVDIPIQTMNPLHIAAQSGDTKAIADWIQSGASLDATYDDYTVSLAPYSEGSGSRVRSKTALMFAAENGHFEATKLLTEAGADIYVVQRYADGHEIGTAFDLAVSHEHTDIAEYLWEKSDRKRLGANFNEMPHMLTSRCQRPHDPNLAHLASYLLDNVVTPAQVSVDLYFISRDECLDIVRSLLTRGIKPSASALVAASQLGALNVMRAYLDTGIDPNKLGTGPPGGFPELPLAVAAGSLRIAAVALLLDYGADPNLIDLMGLTALMIAADGRCRSGPCISRGDSGLGMMKLLLLRGARADVANAQGRTALDFVRATDPEADGKRALLKGAGL